MRHDLSIHKRMSVIIPFNLFTQSNSYLYRWESSQFMRFHRHLFVEAKDTFTKVARSRQSSQWLSAVCIITCWSGSRHGRRASWATNGFAVGSFGILGRSKVSLHSKLDQIQRSKPNKVPDLVVEKHEYISTTCKSVRDDLPMQCLQEAICIPRYP